MVRRNWSDAAVFLVFMGLGLGLGTILFGASLFGATSSPDPDPDRARFMIECVYEWNLSNETCEEVLHGGNLPPLDEDMEVDC